MSRPEPKSIAERLADRGITEALALADSGELASAPLGSLPRGIPTGIGAPCPCCRNGVVTTLEPEPDESLWPELYWRWSCSAAGTRWHHDQIGLVPLIRRGVEAVALQGSARALLERDGDFATAIASVARLLYGTQGLAHLAREQMRYLAGRLAPTTAEKLRLDVDQVARLKQGLLTVQTYGTDEELAGVGAYMVVTLIREAELLETQLQIGRPSTSTGKEN